jgi:BMFP domain-containing protein YqiC
MQTKSPLMDELAKITTAAMGLAQAASEEAKTAFRAQGDKLVAEFDLVRRDELDALKAEITALRAEVAALKPGVKAAAPKSPAATPRKTASTKPKAKPKG